MRYYVRQMLLLLCRQMSPAARCYMLTGRHDFGLYRQLSWHVYMQSILRDKMRQEAAFGQDNLGDMIKIPCR